MDTHYIGSDPNHPLAVRREKLHPRQALAVLQIGRLAFLGLQPDLNDLLRSGLACVLITECCLQLSRNSEVPFAPAGQEAELTDRLLDRRGFVSATLVHGVVLGRGVRFTGSDPPPLHLREGEHVLRWYQKLAGRTGTWPGGTPPPIRRLRSPGIPQSAAAPPTGSRRADGRRRLAQEAQRHLARSVPGRSARPAKRSSKRGSRGAPPSAPRRARPDATLACPPERRRCC